VEVLLLIFHTLNHLLDRQHCSAKVTKISFYTMMRKKV